MFDLALMAHAEDLYVSQSGFGDGSSCVNSLSVSWFNSSGNWGSGAGKISQGDSVHLCGVITTKMTIQADGGAGAPIIILFESGAKLSKSTWDGSYAIGSSSSREYIIIDGGSNGTIESTANGTGLATTNNDVGVSFQLCNGCEVKNLHVGPLYIHTVDLTDNNGVGSVGIAFNGGSNILIHSNIVHDSKWNISYGYRPGNSGISIYDNLSYNTDHGVSVASLGSGSTISGVSIYGNIIHSFNMWDNTASLNHHDGIHVWADGSAGSSLLIDGLEIYNNYIYGNFGSTATAGIYVEETNASSSAVIDNVKIFNNVIANSSENAPCCGLIYMKATDAGGMPSPQIYNNTLVDGTNGSMAVQLQGQGLTGALFKNNIIKQGALGLGVDNSASIASGGSDYNIYYPTGIQFIYNGGWISYASWKTQAGGIDANSSLANPNLDSGFKIQAGSSAAGTGSNLTSLGIAALNSDKAGNVRPATGPWDIGAYQYQSGLPAAGISGKITVSGKVTIK
jgi:hypothetical protein